MAEVSFFLAVSDDKDNFDYEARTKTSGQHKVRRESERDLNCDQMRVAGLFEDDLFSQRQRKRGSVALLVAVENGEEKVLARAETVRADIKISRVPRDWADCGVGDGGRVD